MAIGRRLNILVIILVSYLSVFAQNQTEACAMEWCEQNPLQPIEGIWEYPQDNTRVLIKSDEETSGAYTMIVISTPDCRIQPGDIIARLLPTTDTRQFRMQQAYSKDKSIMKYTPDCGAILSTDGESIRVKTKKLKFKVNPSIILPRFWRLVRISVDNPVEDLPAGLIKIYPGYDHNGSLRRKIRIL